MTTASPRLQLPRRLRLVKLLRAHGLRNAERMREDELKAALERLPLALSAPEDIPLTSPRSRPPSSDVTARLAAAPPEPEPAPPEDDRYDDPHADPRFLEPKIALPDGQRTFLRLIAVDPQQLLVTWDLDEPTRQKAQKGVKIRLTVLDDDDLDGGSYPQVIHDVDLLPGRWYIPAPNERLTVHVELLAASGEVLAVSNAAIVPPTRPARPGPLVWATLPIGLDRRQLADKDLLAGDDPGFAGAEIEHAGETRDAWGRPLEELPSSAEAAPWARARGGAKGEVEKGPPSSSVLARSPPSSSSSAIFGRGQKANEGAVS